MSLWQALLDRLEPVRVDLRKRFRPENPASSVDFSIAFIALAAKLAKADGHVCVREVVMFRQVMEIPAAEEHNVGRIYDLCRQETVGFEAYATRVHRLIRGHAEEELIRENLLDALFHIAMADGVYHPEEDRFLRRTSELLGLAAPEFDRLRARHVPEAWDPYRVLGLSPDTPSEGVREKWKALVRRNHPDLLVSKGLPKEMLLIAERRLQDINRAYEEVLARLERDPANDFSS